MKSRFCWVLLFSLIPLNLQAQNLASPEETAAAIGHYARARTMLMEALKEFERARELAKPDQIVNGDEWRNTLVSRATDLDRLISPEPRISRTGVRFEPSHALLQEENEREPMPIKEEPRHKPIHRSASDPRAALKQTEAVKDVETPQVIEDKNSAAKKALDDLLHRDGSKKADDSAVKALEEAPVAKEIPLEVAPEADEQIPTDSDTPEVAKDKPIEDDAVAKAIEERLKSLEATEAK